MRMRTRAFSIVVAVLLLLGCPLAVLAAYTAWQGSAEVVVEEAFLVEVSNSEFKEKELKWPVSMYPGETKELELEVTNRSGVSLTLHLDVETDTHLEAEWDESSKVLQGGASETFVLQLSAPTNLDTGDYEATIMLRRS